MKQLQLSGAKTLRHRPLLALVAAGAIGLALWGTGDTTEPEAGGQALAEPIAAPTGNGTAAVGRARHLIGFPKRVAAVIAGGNLFSGHSWYVAPPPPPPVKAAPPPPPTAPPLPFSYMGSYAPTGGRAVYYLVNGDRIFDVHLGDTLDGIYTVDAVQDDQLLLTYLPLKQQQALSLRR